MMGIYAIVNTRNGHMYIGSAVDLRQRWRQHRHLLRRGIHHSPRLQRAWAKYGEDAFEFWILEYCDTPERLREVEQQRLDKLEAETKGQHYNSNPLATGHMPGWHHSEASRSKMSAGRKGELHINSKLTDADIPVICARVIGGDTVASVARDYGLKPTTIGDIVNGKSYAHVPCERRRTHKKGQRGSKHGMAKLTEDQVRAIKRRLATGESQVPIARDFGVDQSNVSSIATGRRWAHVQIEE